VPSWPPSGAAAAAPGDSEVRGAWCPLQTARPARAQRRQRPRRARAHAAVLPPAQPAAGLVAKPVCKHSARLRPDTAQLRHWKGAAAGYSKSQQQDDCSLGVRTYLVATAAGAPCSSQVRWPASFCSCPGAAGYGRLVVHKPSCNRIKSDQQLLLRDWLP